MYRNSYQGSWITVFFSGGSKPLQIWDTHIQDGYVTRFLDPDLRSLVFEIRGYNVSTTYMVCPKGKQVLGINMPFMIMIVKNLNQCFCFEVTVRDSTNTKRRFRVANFQSYTQVLPYSTVMPICLETGWNQVIFNLADFTRRTYGKTFSEVDSIKINANIRIKRIYFTAKLFDESDLPPDYRLYAPPPLKGRKKSLEKEKNQANEVPLKALPEEQPQIIHEEPPLAFPIMRRSSTNTPPKEADKINKMGEETNNEKGGEEIDDDQQENMEGQEKHPSLTKKKGQSLQVIKSRTSLVSTDTRTFSHHQSLVGAPSPLRVPSAGYIPERQPATTDHIEAATREELEEAARNLVAPIEEPVRDEPGKPA